MVGPYRLRKVPIDTYRGQQQVSSWNRIRLRIDLEPIVQGVLMYQIAQIIYHSIDGCIVIMVVISL